MWRLSYSIPIWILFILFRTVVILIGFIMVPTAILCNAWHVAPSNGGNNGELRYLFIWKIMAPWQNLEDGFYCKTYFDHGFFWTSVRWSCIRNPANGLRYFPLLSLKIDPTRVRFIGSLGDWDYKYISETAIRNYDSDEVSFWSFTWCGVYSNFRWQFNAPKLLKMIFPSWQAERLRFWIGWKIYPEDIYGVTDHRKESAGFATQFKRCWPR